MAIKAQYSFKGVVIPEAYIRLESISGSKGGGLAVFSLYANEDLAKTPPVQPLTPTPTMNPSLVIHTFHVSLSKEDLEQTPLYELAYRELKKIVEFSNVVDA